MEAWNMKNEYIVAIDYSANYKPMTIDYKMLKAENLMDARILLVEDNEINIYVAQLILEKAGCVVEIANGTYHCHDSGCF